MKPDIKEAEVIPKFLQDSFIDWEMQVRLSGTYKVNRTTKDDWKDDQGDLLVFNNLASILIMYLGKYT